MNHPWSSNKEQFELEIKETLSELLESGLIEVVGEDESGLDRYALTELGKSVLGDTKEDERKWK